LAEAHNKKKKKNLIRLKNLCDVTFLEGIIFQNNQQLHLTKNPLQSNSWQEDVWQQLFIYLSASCYSGINTHNLERGPGLHDLFWRFIHNFTVKYVVSCSKFNGSRKREQPFGMWPHSWSGLAAVDWCYLISTSSDPNLVRGLSQNLHNSLLLTDYSERIDSMKLQKQWEVEVGERKAGQGLC